MRTVGVKLDAQVAAYVAAMTRAEAATAKFARNGEAYLAKHGQTLSLVGRSAGLAGLAVAGSAALMVNKYADFDAVMSDVEVSTGAVGASLAALREAALTAGADTKYSATEAAQGVNELGKAGVATRDILNGGLAGALSLAAVGELAVADAAEVTATTLKQFNLEGAQAGHVADLLAAGANKSVGSVHDLAMGLKQAGIVANAFGIPIEETVGTLSLFASNALIGSDAGTSFKAMLLALTTQTEDQSKAMEAYNIQLYDANGQFLGIENMAGQLRSQLSGLTEEQRQNTLALLFGSDAVRAATILYDKGAQGVREMTDAINVNGYANEAAAKKMDNLKGDIEQFMGSVETAAIGFGEGGDGVLRSFTQAATKAVNAVGDMPPAMKQGALAAAGVGAAGLLAFAGVTKLAVGALELRNSWNELVPKGSRARGAIAGVGKAALVGATAFAAAGAAARLMEQEFGGAAAGAEDAEVALTALGTSGSKGLGELDRLFQDAKGGWGSNDLVAGVNDIESAFDRLFNRSGGQKFGDNLSGITRGLMGVETEVSIVESQFNKLDTSLAGLRPELAAQAFQQIAERAEASGVSVDNLLTLFPQYAAGLREQAAALGVANLSNQELVQWMGGQVPPAVQAAADTAKAAGKDISEMAGSLDEANAAARETANSLLTLSGSEIALESAFDSANKTIRGNGRTLDISTEKGRANRSALNGIAEAALRTADAMTKANVPAAKVAATMARGRDKFISAAVAAGMSERAAGRLATKLGLVSGAANKIPRKKSTEVSAPGADRARRQVDTFRNRVDGLAHSRSTKISVTASGTSAAKRAIDEAARVRHTTILVKTQKIKADGGLEFYERMADGGTRSFTGELPRIFSGDRGNGVTMAERGSGPWEGWVSGHPAKRNTSRQVTEDIARLLGGEVQWHMADGGTLVKQPIPTGWSPIPAQVSSSSTLSLAGVEIAGVLEVPGIGQGYLRGVIQGELDQSSAHAKMRARQSRKVTV